MWKSLTMIALVAALPASTALADEDCFVPMANWQPRAAVAQLAAEHGWIVRRIKVDDGCYEINGTDAEGRRIEVTVQPDTLQLLSIEYDDNAPRPARHGDGHAND